MPKKTIEVTPHGFDTLQCRLSVKETQEEFAKRFRVSKTTIYQWERGAVRQAQRIYAEILSGLKARLKTEGRLLPDEVVYVIFKGGNGPS